MALPGAEALLERDIETADLQRAVDHSAHGVGRLVMIEGPAGIGKTSLVDAARDRARRAGMNVRVARGAELERSFAFGVVRQLFDPLVATAGAAEREEWFAGAAQLAAPLFDAHALMDERGGQDSIYPRMHGLYWMCSNIARPRPIALCIDDAQWADGPSLAFFGFLARRLDELPMLLLVAARASDPGTPDSLTALFGETIARVLKPRALSAHGVEQMLVAWGKAGVDEPFALACRAATGGNPFLLRELFRELDEAGIEPLAANAPRVRSLGPRRLADTVLARLARLSPAAPALARAVAILGDGASITMAAALAGVDQGEAVAAAAAMRSSDLLAHDVGLTFAHAIIRAAIYDSELPASRVIDHARAAALLHERGAPAEQVAAQILLADGFTDAWVSEQLRLAAESSMALGAPGNAIAYLERALTVEAEPDRQAPLLAQLGHAEALAGIRDAPEHLEAAVRLTSDPEERALIAIALAQVLKLTGRATRAVELLSALPPLPDAALSDQITMELLSAALISHGALQLLADRIVSLEDRGAAASLPRERFELALLGFGKVLANAPVAEITDLIDRAGAVSSAGDDRIILPPGAVAAGAALLYCDRLEEAAVRFEAIIERARRHGSLAHLLIGLSRRAEVAYRRGDLGEALADATAAYDLFKDVSAVASVLLPHPIAMINNIAAEQERSDSELAELLRVTDQNLDRDALHIGLTLHSRARVLLARGQPALALDQLRELGELDASFGVATPAFIPWRSDAALILNRLGDRAAAAQLAEDEVELATAMGAPRAIGISLRAFALVQPSPSVEMLEQAVEVLERSPARLEQARALVDLGATMRRAAGRAAARAPLREGHEIALLCGATRLAARARHEIAASGARMAPLGLHGAAALTPSERRVAELAAQGQTNRDIAQTLFITEKTVETHLRHVFDKLDVRSRHKLASLLGEADPDPQRV